MSPILLTKNTTFILGTVAEIIGYIMNAIYNVMDNVFGIQNVGLSIILLTFIVYLAMIPLTIRQQKFSKLSAVTAPEIQAIQKKYKNKKDQASMMKQQEETKAVYEKYGTSPTGGCLPLIIQLPILLSLYRVIMNVPAYIDRVKAVYIPLIDDIKLQSGFQKIMETFGAESSINISPDKFDFTKTNTLVDVLYKFQDSTWATLTEKFPNLEQVINNTSTTIVEMNTFLGINIAEAPITNWKSPAILIPILAGLSQFLNTKLMPQQSMGDDASTMASSMKTMNMVMPIMSAAFCLTLPAGLGLYWTAAAVFRSIQQVIINKYMNRVSVEELVAKNVEKANKKREKKGLPANTISNKAKTNVRNIEEPKAVKSQEEKKKEAKEALDYYNKDAKEGSLASKANMVRKFNEKKNK